MKYKKINMGSYNLHLIKTDKFKTTTVSVNFADRLKKDEITIRKFLFQMLCLSTKKYNTERLLSIKLEDLYGADLNKFEFLNTEERSQLKKGLKVLKRKGFTQKMIDDYGKFDAALKNGYKGLR